MPALARFSSMLRIARERGYAVAAFNVYNLESMTAAVRAAIATKTPVIVALGERYFPNLRPATARALLISLLEQYERDGQEIPPIGLHLDHSSSPDTCREAIRSGFTSVMIDGSHLPFRENVSLTRIVVEEAHAHGVEVEAELGGLAAGEGSHEFITGEQTLTDPDQAEEFVSLTGVDALAVSVGTVHGLYRGEPHIDLDRLAAIHARVDVPLVLHGGSGTPAELLRECVARGVAKVNVNTEVSLAAVRRIQEQLDAHPNTHYAELGLAAVDAMEEVMKDYIQRFGAPIT